MDNMDWLSDLMGKISLNTFDLDEEYWVDVTHINSPHSFYVRPTSYRMYMPTIQKYSEQLNFADLHINALVVFQSEELKDYLRGIIIAIENTNGTINCNIFAVDYGFLEMSVCIERIKTLISFNLRLPPLATHCQLADCQPIHDKFTVSSIDAMKWYIGKERVKIVVKEKKSDILVVELINFSQDNVATLLAVTGYTNFTSTENDTGSASALMSDELHFEYKDLKVDDCIHVRVQSGKSLAGFFVAEVKDYKKYVNESQDFSDFCREQKSLSIQDIKMGSPVAIYLDSMSRYERALVQNIDETMEIVTVQLIDWGTTTATHVSRIKAMTNSFFFHPAIAIYCATEDYQVWDHGLQKFLYTGFEFLLTVKKVGDKFNSPNIVNVSRY